MFLALLSGLHDVGHFSAAARWVEVAIGVISAGVSSLQV